MKATKTKKAGRRTPRKSASRRPAKPSKTVTDQAPECGGRRLGIHQIEL